MFGAGFEEIGFVLFIAFLLFGPKKLPEIARTLGKGLSELRRARDELKFSLEEELRTLDAERHQLAEDVSKTLDIDRYQIEDSAEEIPAYGHHTTEPTVEEHKP